MTYQSNKDDFMEWVKVRNPHMPEFAQAAYDIAIDVVPIINAHKDYKDLRVLHQLAEPNRIVMFKVAWEDDKQQLHINRGWRVQQSNVLGPYKGGLRFHPSVNQSVLQFLAFEQCFKNALTGLSLGGAKGGSDFNPKGRSDAEIRRFCSAFMRELHRHIGPNTDVPAGDINVGQREIGFLFGEYRRLANEYTGSLTGKQLAFGGSRVRVEATGYGVLYFTQCVLDVQGESLSNLRINISGAGNVALYAAQKAIQLGGCVQTLSNSRGTLFKQAGLSENDIKFLLELPHHDNALKAFSEERDAKWIANEKPWSIQCDIAIPCATQNELQGSDAKRLLKNDTRFVVEGANMPLTQSASEIVRDSNMTYVPGKAANAGGVALSGFEMEQNKQFHQLDFDTLDKKLKNVMQHIHQQCITEADKQGVDPIQMDYVRSANVAGFRRLADAIVAQGF